MALATRMVTATLREPDTETPLQGTVTFTPGGGVLVDPVSGRILAGAATEKLDRTGSLALPLVPTDTTGIQPVENTWNWDVVFNLVNSAGVKADIDPFNFALPSGSGSVDLASVIQVAAMAGTYLVVPGPPGAKGDKGDKGDAGSGGGSADPTRTAYITDDNLSGLPAAGSWAVVVTSGGSRLVCSIPAVVGDRIELHPNMMYVGSHFLDWVILNADGSIAQYAGSLTSSPLPEGLDDDYPLLTLSKHTSTEMFTVAAPHLNAGSVTVGLAHQGTGTGSSNIVYAHPVYPWRLRIKNIGPEPA